MAKTVVVKQRDRFIADRKRFFTADCNYIKISKKDILKKFGLMSLATRRMNNSKYTEYLMYLAQFLNEENKLVAMDCSKKYKLQKEDIIERLIEGFNISEKTVENFLSAAKKENLLIREKCDRLTEYVYIMNPIAFNQGYTNLHVELLEYFSEDIKKFISPYQYDICLKIFCVDYNKYKNIDCLSMVDTTRYNVEKIINGEMFKIEGAFKETKLMSWNKAKELFERRGITEVIGLPLNTRFNCIFHQDESELAVVISNNKKERYFCKHDNCVCGTEYKGLDVFDMIAKLMGIENEDDKFNLAMEYLANLYNVQIEKTATSIFNEAPSESDPKLASLKENDNIIELYNEGKPLESIAVEGDRIKSLIKNLYLKDNPKDKETAKVFEDVTEYLTYNMDNSNYIIDKDTNSDIIGLAGITNLLANSKHNLSKDLATTYISLAKKANILYQDGTAKSAKYMVNPILVNDKLTTKLSKNTFLTFGEQTKALFGNEAWFNNVVAYYKQNGSREDIQRLNKAAK